MVEQAFCIDRAYIHKISPKVLPDFLPLLGEFSFCTSSIIYHWNGVLVGIYGEQ
ncbi:MAG: hypothetical protein RL407_2106 [Bacteroidota bacterium]|jgi:hypothetical protein